VWHVRARDREEKTRVLRSFGHFLFFLIQYVWPSTNRGKIEEQTDN
jgi:hypothetical protein